MSHSRPGTQPGRHPRRRAENFPATIELSFELPDGSESLVSRVPPLVHYRPARGPAYLLAWELRADGWWALVAWIEYDGDTYRGKEAWAIGDDVQKLPGQRYEQVPRWRSPQANRPSDPYDPRNPGKRSRAQDRAAVEAGLPPSEEPNF